jgi:hypothetical protein
MPEASDGAVTPAAGANPPERNKDSTSGLFGLAGSTSRSPLFRLAQIHSPDCAGRFGAPLSLGARRRATLVYRDNGRVETRKGTLVE